MGSSQKTVLITGCSLGGIGDSLAQCFQKHNFQVFATARNLSKVQHLKALGMTVLALDVQDPASIAKAVEAVTAATGGKLDVLVNNSGAGHTMPLLDVDIKAAENTFDINVWGVLRTTQAFAPLLITASGTVVNVGSTAGVVNIPFRGVYSASKAAVNSMSESLRIELKPLGVKVVALIAGAVKTNFSANAATQALPQDSVYKFARDLVEKAMAPEALMVTSITADGFAEVTVRNLMKKNPKKRQWEGTGSWFIWFVSSMFWHSFPGFLFGKMFGMDKVEAAWQAKKKHN